MARWLVQLSGDVFDLEEFPRFFPSGDVHVIVDNNDYFLVGPALEAETDSEVVRQKAISSLERFSAIISLLVPDQNQVAIGALYRDRDDGVRDSFVFVLDSIRLRDRAGAFSETQDNTPEPDGVTRGQRLLQRACESAHLAESLSLWRQTPRTWPKLYRILEEIEGDLGCRVDAAGICLASERNRFRRTANTPESSGSDARHGSGKVDPPANPMSKADAEEFIRTMLLKTMEMLR